MVRWWHRFFELIYPPCCISCSARLVDQPIDTWLCHACVRTIRYVSPPYCHRCGRSRERSSVHDALCLSCATHRPYFAAGCVGYQYRDAMRTCLHAVKFHSHKPLAHWLGQRLGDLVQAQRLPTTYDLILPVPLHPMRQRHRGFNQAEVLARHVGDALRVPLDVDALRRTRATQPQSALAAAHRHANVAAAFAVTHPARVAHAQLLLVDDILTTGATLNACAHVLQQAGASRIDVLTLASN